MHGEAGMRPNAPFHAAATDTIAPDTVATADQGEDNDSIEPTEADDTYSNLPLEERLRHLLDNDIFERTQVGISVFDLTADTLVFSYHAQQCMRPASNEKLVTAITAL